MRPRLLALLAALALSGAAAAPAGAAVPTGFLGVVADGPALDPALDLAAETAKMRANGAGSLRTQFSWAGAQPYATWDAVPADARAAYVDEGGVPTAWGSLDRIVAAAAQQRLLVLPVVQYAPGWGAVTPGRLASPPQTAPYARFLGALVRRYGPTGTFWTANPQLPRTPIRSWQVWNEPELRYQWLEQPFVARYRSLLKASRTAIKGADRGAKVVLGGLTNKSWETLDRLYRARYRGLFDAVALHPYTEWARGVMTIIRRVRRVLNARGDRRVPIIATEVGWSSSIEYVDAGLGIETTEAEQARRIGTVLKVIDRDRRELGIGGVFIYTWMGFERPYPDTVFDFAGLRRLDEQGRYTDKPALATFRRAAARMGSR